jgi:hypothetical protein
MWFNSINLAWRPHRKGVLDDNRRTRTQTSPSGRWRSWTACSSGWCGMRSGNGRRPTPTPQRPMLSSRRAQRTGRQLIACCRKHSSQQQEPPAAGHCRQSSRQRWVAPCGPKLTPHPCISGCAQHSRSCHIQCAQVINLCAGGRGVADDCYGRHPHMPRAKWPPAESCCAGADRVRMLFDHTHPMKSRGPSMGVSRMLVGDYHDCYD